MKLDFNKRPLSWSQLSSFHYDRMQWYESYIEGKRQSSPELTFGSYVDKRIQDDPTFLPHLPRYEHMQYKLSATFEGIKLVGIPDGLNLITKELADYKTGKKAWDKKRADETGQLTFYLFLIFLSLNLRPEDFKCCIHWLPTEYKKDGTIGLITDDVETFYTKRTMIDILEFGNFIQKTVKDMERFLLSYPQPKISKKMGLR